MRVNKTAIKFLADADPVIARLIEQVGPISLQPRRLSTFHSLLHAIIHQQLSGKAAKAILNRFLELLKMISKFEVPWKKDFDDPKLEFRRLFSEALGTFFLVLVAVGGNVVYLMYPGSN